MLYAKIISATLLSAALIVILFWTIRVQEAPVFSGIVDVDGQPITKGRLILTPDRDKGNQGNRILCDIRDGEFCFYEDQRCTPGPNVAIVTVHPLPEPDGSISLEKLALMEMYMFDLEIPAGELDDFRITVPNDGDNKNSAEHIAQEAETKRAQLEGDNRGLLSVE